MPETKPVKSRKILYTLLAVGLGLLFTFALLFGKPKPQPSEPPVLPPAAVDVLSLRPAAMQVTVNTQGTVQPRREIDLVTQVAGKVEWVADNFAAGGFFDQQKSLLRIEQADYQYALIRARAKVADAEQLLATEQGRARQAQREWRELGSEQANALFLRKPQLASTEAAVASAKAELAQAELDLQRTQVRSPFNGRIRETYVDLGQYVTAGSKVARIYSTDRVEVRLPLTDRQVALLDLPLSYHGQQADTAVSVTLLAEFAGRLWQWPATITRTDASIDIESRVLYAVAEVSDPFQRSEGSDRPPLSIGQYVEAEIAGREMANLIAIPRQALRAKNTLWTLDADNRLRIVNADVVQVNDSEVLLRLPDDQPLQLIVSSLNLAIEGMALSPRSDSGESVLEEAGS